MAAELIKKREVFPPLKAAICKLTDMAADCAKLEYHDNDEASRRLKRALVDFEQVEFKNLKETVKEIRLVVNSKKIRTKKSKEQ